jgi:hypothetical protein
MRVNGWPSLDTRRVRSPNSLARYSIDTVPKLSGKPQYRTGLVYATKDHLRSVLPKLLHQCYAPDCQRVVGTKKSHVTLNHLVFHD